jgi:tRNA dimethylallyltransferase
MSEEDMSEEDMSVPDKPFAVAVVAIFGPTASGKTSLAEAVADRLATEVISCDALQVYRGLPLLTNQPSRPTRLVAIRDLDQEMSVGEYALLAHEQIDELVGRFGIAVVAGGTGLYLRAAIADLSIPRAVGAEARGRWEAVYDRDPQAAHKTLACRDPAAASAVHVNDRRRVVRALELAEAGESLASADSRLWSSETRLPTRVVGLEVPAGELERRIRERTRRMFEEGVVAEVDGALRRDISRTAATTLGLQEIAGLGAAEAEERIAIRTRRYATYQRKWLRRIPGLTRLDGTRDTAALAEEVVRMVSARSPG